MNLPIPDFQFFHGLWNVVICSIAGFLLYQVWKVLVVKKSAPADKGGLYLAVSLIFWVASGLFDVLDWSGGLAGWKYWPLVYNLARSWFSTWNSVFILFAVHHFDLVPRWFAGLLRHPDWKKWVRGAGLLVSALAALSALRIGWGQVAPLEPGATLPNQVYTGIFLWDFIFSTFTSVVLLVLIRHILQHQDFQRLAWIGFFLIGIILLAQFLDFQGNDAVGNASVAWLSFWKYFFLNTYKALLVILFALLLLSWAIRVPAAETVVLIPEAEICQRYGILPRDIAMLRALARGETRESITPLLFPGKTGREPVDDRQKELAAKFLVPNNVVAILMFALKNGVISLKDC